MDKFKKYIPNKQFAEIILNRVLSECSITRELGETVESVKEIADNKYEAITAILTPSVYCNTNGCYSEEDYRCALQKYRKELDIKLEKEKFLSSHYSGPYEMYDTVRNKSSAKLFYGRIFIKNAYEIMRAGECPGYKNDEELTKIFRNLFLLDEKLGKEYAKGLQEFLNEKGNNSKNI